MNRILTSSEMYLCDRTEIETRTPSRELMYRAARACADEIRAILAQQPQSAGTVAILCGSGNNGGDGILCAHLLCEDGIPAVIVPAFSDNDRLSDECAYRLNEARQAGVPILSADAFLRGETPTIAMLVDALFGIGLTREPDGISAALIDAANDISKKHHIPTAAIDIASGIFADTAKTGAHTIRADHTLAINNAKRGHLLYPGAAYTGQLHILDIGISESPLASLPEGWYPKMPQESSTERVTLPEGDCPKIPQESSTEGVPLPIYMLTDDDARALLPARLPDSNKGTNKRILVAAGSRGMCGAAYLSALAALRTGAGLVEIFTAEDNRIPLQTRLPEAIMTTYDPADPSDACDRLRRSMARADAVVIGPGLGMSDTAVSLVKTVLAAAAVPTVLDADALNILAAHCLFPLLHAACAPLILTPHPGELSRLTGKPVAALLDDPITAAHTFASEHGVTLNAKDTRSVITDGKRAYINPTGTSALAKGGSGDVLSGITATLAAQMFDAVQMCNDAQECSLLDAAALAAYLHGRAAERVTARMGARSPLASEIADALGEVLLRLTGT